MGEFTTPTEQFLSAFSRATDKVFESYIPRTPDETEMGVKQKMVADPSDNQVALMSINAERFKLISLRDISVLFTAMYEASLQASEYAGFAVYPLLQVVKE